MTLKSTCLDPVTRKELNCFFVVYSPKVFDNTKAKLFLDAIQFSPHILVTDEYGDSGKHKHRNYFFYSHHRDGWNLARAHKLAKPEWVCKTVSSPNNVVTYITKEVCHVLPLNTYCEAAVDGGRRPDATAGGPACGAAVSPAADGPRPRPRRVSHKKGVNYIFFRAGRI